MGTYRPDHLHRAKEIEEAVRNRPRGSTPHAIRAQALALYEVEIIEKCVAVALYAAHEQRLKGAGTMLLMQKGERDQADVDRYVTRFNMCNELAEAIKTTAAQIPSKPEGEKK